MPDTAPAITAWIVLERPAGFPGSRYVALPLTLEHHGASATLRHPIGAETLAQVRGHLPPGLRLLGSAPRDQIGLIEVWTA